MTGKTHRIIGIASGITYLLAQSKPEYSPATLGVVLVGSYFGSLLPDLDQPAAEIWDSLPFGHLVGHAIDPFIKHRNISHSLLGLALVSVGFYYLFNLFPDYWAININIALVATVVSYASHLIADMLTEEGIPLFFPIKYMFGIPPKPFEHVRITTGKWFENLIIFPASNVWLIFIIITKWDLIKVLLFK